MLRVVCLFRRPLTWRLHCGSRLIVDKLPTNARSSDWLGVGYIYRFHRSHSFPPQRSSRRTRTAHALSECWSEPNKFLSTALAGFKPFGHDFRCLGSRSRYRQFNGLSTSLTIIRPMSSIPLNALTNATRGFHDDEQWQRRHDML